MDTEKLREGNKGCNKKLFILGIDGGSFELINSLIEKGKLPHFKDMIEKGTKSIMKSSIPPLTAPAWASLQTGCNPGKHGVYDFTLLDGWDSYFVNSKELGEKPFWLYLSEQGIKSIIMNVPLTYPVYAINGILVGGMETPSEMHNYTYPPELKKELNEKGYVIEPLTYQKSYDEIRKILADSLDRRIDAARMLMKREWDLFLFFIRETDIIQHYFWNNEDVGRVYEKIDQFLGALMTEDFDLMIMSDHGFEKVDKAININTWLAKEGYLSLKKEKKGFIDKKTAQKILEKAKLDWMRRVVPRKLKRFLKEDIGFEEAVVKQLIEWDKTKAIVKRSVKTVNIYINTKLRSEKGIVEEKDYEIVREELLNKLKKFFEKEKINVKIWKKEELYFGKAINNAPDIIIYLPRGMEANCFMFSNEIYVPLQEKIAAQHNQEAILILKKKRELKKRPDIVDFAPTILSYFNISVPEQMDGKPLF